MKKTLLLLTLLVLSSSSGWAAACSSSTLDVYLASGFSCTEDGLTFSSFLYEPQSTVPAADVNVTALGNGLGFGPFSIGPGQHLAFALDYTIFGDLRNIQLSILSPSIAGLGGIVGFENVASNGMFLSAQVKDFAGSGLIGSVILPIPSGMGPTFRVEKDLVLSTLSGVGSMASVEAVVNQSNVPEPGSLLLFGSGLLALGGYVRRRTSK